ncbi:DNA adenine methylase [Rhodobacterales bacterium HKCCE4037]|nr:DNA adenine methylase [Rhodobacterales bacterium HKCCE4037]
MKPSRPILRYHGGKWRLAPWITSYFPAHRTYVEPYGGGASVLLRKSPSYSEVYNDLSDEVVNLFEVLRSRKTAARLVDLVARTPFARREFEAAFEVVSDPVERARRLLIRSAMGFGPGLAVNFQSTGFRSDSKKSGSTPARNWAGFSAIVEAVADRFSGVIIEHRPALEVIEKHDASGTLFYIDPPYVHDTRSSKSSSGTLHHRYAHEMTDADHRALLDTIKSVEGKVVLSGYPHPLYDSLLADWCRVETEALADGARRRVEVLWMNFDPSVAAMTPDLFAEAAE